MRNWSIPLILIVCWLIAGPVSEAGAVGLGAYVERGSGSGDWDAERDDTGLSWDFETDDTRTGFGFVLDTNVARDRLFNYRLQVGYEKFEAESKSGGTYTLKGISITNDFGFGILRTPHVRLWLGPELKLAYVYGSPDNNDNFDIDLFQYGIGPVIGANFHIGRTVTLAVKTGYIFGGFVGTGEGVRDGDETFTGTSTEFFVNFALIFRIGDVF